MKKCNTTQQLGREIYYLDEAETKLSVNKCNMIAKKIIKLYRSGGKREVICNIAEMPLYVGGERVFHIEECIRAKKITERLFRWHWVPFSAIRRSMRTLA